MKKNLFSSDTLLQAHDLKITPLRVFVLELLQHSPTPLTVAAIAKKAKRIADPATTYRALNAFVEKGIVRKLSLIDNKASFELVTDSTHVHHIICTTCQSVEPIDVCIKNINDSALKKSKQFKLILDHMLSFAGTCKKCVRAIR